MRARTIGRVVGTAVGLGAALWLLRAEDRRPLRSAGQPRARRQLTNLALGAGSLAMAGLVQTHVLTPLLARDTGRFGLVRTLPARLRPLAAFLLLDWAMYWWHRATHRVDALWRLHRVHHVDLGLDMSTAIRFHAIDQIVSAPMRIAMIVLIGPDARTHETWNRWFFANVLFHHTNVRLPYAAERWLSLVITTPAMHGIHHMARRDLSDANWTAGFSWWDRLHGSFRADLPANAVRIGIAGYAAPVDTVASLALPAASTADDWPPGTDEPTAIAR
ncbi:MAG: sterol desaturase family protein [Pseudomonadota bacterium]